MPHVPEVLKCLFSSTLRIKLLSHYFAHPREYFYVRQLAGALDYSAGNVARELANLERNGLLISRTTGNRKHYAVAQSSPFVHDLRSIFMKANSAHGILGDPPGKEKPVVALTGDEQVVFRAIAEGVSAAEDIVTITKLPAAAVQRSLVMLEMKGCIEKTTRGLYHRKDD